jgi:2-methylfumaryl-CoA hydratase
MNKPGMARMTTHSDGNFFEDFTLGQMFVHHPQRRLTAGDVSLNIALTGTRFDLPDEAPLDDALVFNLVFSQSVADISKNALANLGYASVTFGVPVQIGDCLSSRSEVIGLRQTSKGDSGIVYVHTTGQNQRSEVVLSLIRWVLVKKRDLTVPAPAPVIPELPVTVHHHTSQAGDRITHGGGVLITEAAHQLATRFYQNPARLHFDPAASPYGKCLVYGGYIIALARALMVNGLEKALYIRAINSGQHTNPVFAGDVIYAGSEVLEIPAPGLLRVRLLAAKHEFTDWPATTDPSVVLDLDLTLHCL